MKLPSVQKSRSLLAAHPVNIESANGSNSSLIHQHDPDLLPLADKPGPAELPLELVILYRFGVRYAHLIAAWEMSRKYGIAPSLILIRAGVVDEQTWVKAQLCLIKEQEKSLFHQKVQNYLLDRATNGLRTTEIAYSASQTLTKGQKTIFVCILAVTMFAVFHAKTAALWAILLSLAVFYSANILMRGWLLLSYRTDAGRFQSLSNVPSDASLPAYSVLVALYKEEAQVGELCRNLARLDWPNGKLDIKLICEDDDHETIRAILEINLPPFFSLVRVPASEPRTKPKALNYALPLCTGEYVVLYDAEDIPHPKQLREAFFAFQTGPENLACLQAPLSIHNNKQNWLTRMFSIEYRTLFVGILPTLARWGAPMPLGGTSNHFRKDVLIGVGGWDPFNVTEDADLGIRLQRKGYACGTISLPTLEEAPPRMIPWVRQRTRWIKGWMQTVLVHNRDPARLFRDLGWKNAMIFQLLLGSLVVSALIHPFFLGVVLYQIFDLTNAPLDILDIYFTGTTYFNLVGGYTTYGLLAYAVLNATGASRQGIYLISLPAYWLLISFAAWRALVHLALKPHHWEKTPHGLANDKITPKLE